MPGLAPLAPPLYDPTQFRWERYPDYRYYLIRGGSETLYRYMGSNATLVTQSGKWRLYERVGSLSATSKPATDSVPQ